MVGVGQGSLAALRLDAASHPWRLLDEAGFPANLRTLSQAGSRDAIIPTAVGGVSARDYGPPGQAALQAAITACGGLERTIVLTPGTWEISDKLRTPANVTIAPERGAVVKVTIPDVDIADLSRAAACVVSWTGHGLETGDRVYISGITQADWTALNGRHFSVTRIDADRFSIPVNTSGYAAAYNPAVDPGVITKTLDIAGQVSAGLYRVFDAAPGKVAFSAGTASEYYSEWFGAVGDGVANDSAAWQILIAALPEGAHVVAQNKTYAVNNVEFNVNYGRFTCLGRFKPAANSGYVLRFGHAAGVVASEFAVGIVADGVRVDSGGYWSTRDAVNAVEVLNLYEGKIDIREAKGCSKGVYVYGNNPSASNGGCTNNIITLGEISNNKHNVHLTALDEGWCNDNLILGGYLTWNTASGAGATEWSIYVTFTNDAHVVNNNIFIKPMCEGAGNFIHLGGIANRVLDFRHEDSGVWPSNKLVFADAPAGCTTKSSRCELKFGHGTTLHSKLVPVVGGAYTTTQVNEFTVNSDVTPNVWIGELIKVTVTGSVSHYAPVIYCSYSAGTGLTTIRLGKNIFTPGSVEAIGLAYPPVQNLGATGASGSGNVMVCPEAGAPGTYTNWTSERSTMRFCGPIFPMNDQGSATPALNLQTHYNGLSTDIIARMFGLDGLKYWQRADGRTWQKGALGLAANSAPADGDLAAGELYFWFDPTNGAPKLRAKAKQADGTVVTFTINAD